MEDEALYQGQEPAESSVIDLMLLYVVFKADHFIKCIRDREGKVVPLCKACDDPFTHMQLSDEFILKTIQNSSNPELEAGL